MDILVEQHTQVGGKASQLYKLKALGMNVPDWIVITVEELVPVFNYLKECSSDVDVEEIKRLLPNDLIARVTNQLPQSSFYAVRSSGANEDGVQHSFAGQYSSFMYVQKEELLDYVVKVCQSAFSEHVEHYVNRSAIKEYHSLAVIIQIMVDASVSGVAFGMNPVTGNREEQVISSVFGLGEGLVSGEIDSDNFKVNKDEITQEIALKKVAVRYDEQKGKGTTLVGLPEEQQRSPSISLAQVREVSGVLKLIEAYFGKWMDIEFAYIEEELVVLQARPITTVNQLPDKSGVYKVWDNSNIIESYPGVTTPLTFSFISPSYEGAYRLFCSFMGVKDEVIAANDQVFKNTLGFINGRVYYNLKSWYLMLAMLPGYSLNARFMENMMGVKERFDVPSELLMSKRAAGWSMFKMGIQLLKRGIQLPRSRKKFYSLLDSVIAEYKAINLSSKDAVALMELYLNFERKLLNEWKAPLVNDFFAMIYFGLLQKRCEKYIGSSNPNIHNDLLCGSADIISTQPIHRSIAIATEVEASPVLKPFFNNHSSTEIWEQMNRSDDSEWVRIKKMILAYISDFGERCVGELKLETVSYTQAPELFVQVVQNYVKAGITSQRVNTSIEEELRKNAEQELSKSLKFKPLKHFILNRTVYKARRLVSARENLRYERTRAFGIVRSLFNAIGENWSKEGVLDEGRDIFYLTKEEIFAFIDGRSIDIDVKSVVARRKKVFSDFEQQNAPSERFETYGMVYHGNNFYATNKIEVQTGDLKGIGCCPGVVKAKVKVVRHPSEVESLEGSILVTSSTDPGWVTLFPSAGGIIVERGSLLSHSAIVSREMGIPCIVGVTGLLSRLKSGMEVVMDGSTGQIEIVEENDEK